MHKKWKHEDLRKKKCGFLLLVSLACNFLSSNERWYWIWCNSIFKTWLYCSWVNNSWCYCCSVRVFDAITDPMIASLSDKSNNPKGRRIPFMKMAAFPFALTTIIVFCAPVQNISMINSIWVLFFLILFYLFQTFFCDRCKKTYRLYFLV